ncbi:MAG: PTS transporter subunit IIC [Propionibacterium sp.]
MPWTEPCANTIPFFVALIVPSRKGNIFQTVLTGTVVMALALLMATDFGPVLTKMMNGVVTVPGGGTEMSNLDTGGRRRHAGRCP